MHNRIFYVHICNLHKMKLYVLHELCAFSRNTKQCGLVSSRDTHFSRLLCIFSMISCIENALHFQDLMHLNEVILNSYQKLSF